MSLRNAALVGALALGLGASALAMPVGQSRETLGAAIARSPLAVVATVATVEQSSTVEELAELRVESVLRAEPDLAVEEGAEVLAVSYIRLDHAVRFEAGSRVIAFLRSLGDGRFEPMARLDLAGKAGVAMEAAARNIAAARSLEPGAPRDEALAEVYARQALEGGADVAGDAAIELVRHGALRERLSTEQVDGIVGRLRAEPNRSTAKEGLIELAGMLRAPGTAEALVTSLGAPGSNRVRGLACRALKYVGAGEAGALLRGALGGAETLEARVSLLTALGALQVTEAGKDVRGLLDDPSEEVRLAAVRALGTFGTEEALESLEGAAERDASEAVRRAAGSLLENQTR